MASNDEDNGNGIIKYHKYSNNSYFCLFITTKNLVEFRSPQSDIEIPKTRKRNTEFDGDSTDTLAAAKGAFEVTKENMSTSRRPNSK